MPATAVSSSSSGYKSSHTGHSRSSFDSYSNDEVSLRFKARNMVFSLMHALNKSAQKQIATPLRLFLFAVELLQLLTFVIEPSLPYWGIEGTSVATVLRYITYVRTIRVDYNAQAAILWIAFAYVVIVLGLSAELAIFSLENGEGSDSRRLKLLSFMTVGVLPVVWVYFVDTLLAFLNCSAFDGDTIVSRFATEHILCDSNRHIAFMGFGFVTLLCLIPIMAVTTLLMHRPQKGGKWGIWDLVNGRVLCLLVFVKAMLVAYLEYMIHIPSGLQGGVYTWLGMILSAILLGYGIYFVPFLKKSANLVWIGVTSACLYGFLFAFAAGNARDVMSPTLVLIGFFVSFIPVSVFVCIVAYYVRLKPLYHWRYDSQKFKTFKRPFEVEICSRLAQQTNVNEDQIINTFTLGMEQYRDDGFLKVAYAMFLLEKKCDFHLLTITLDRARNTHMPFDIKFLVFYIERERLNSTLAMDGGAEEIHKKLLAVKKHSKRARMYIKTFWDVLLKEEDLESLPEIVASVELEEKRANTILQKLREKYPRNVSVLRHYAVFLEKVKNDPEAAHAALRAADEIEEEKAVRHRKKSSLKKSKKTDSVKTSARKTEPPKSPMPIKSPQQQNAEAAQVRFKELISRPYTPALPHSVNADQLDTEALIAQLSIDSNPPSPHDKAIVEANEMTNADYEYYERQKSPIARSRDDIPHPEEDTPDSDEDVEQGHHRNAHHSDGESDKESNVTGSTFSFEQLKSMKRSDLLRYRKYRYLTENSKSNALRKLKIAINLTLLILLVDIVVVFATTQQMMVTFSSSVTGLANAANANYLTHNAALQVQQLRAAVLLKNNVTEKAIRDTLGGRMDHLAELMTQLYQGNDGYEPLTKGWAVEEYNIERWNSGLQQASYLKESLWDAINEFMWMVEQIAISPSSKLTVLAQSTPLKFVLDNGPNEIYRALTNLVNLFVDRNNFYGHSLTVLGSVLISASFVLLCVLIIFLSRPATNEIKSERSEMLRLFLSIPKSSVSAVSKKISAQEDEEHEQANTGDVDEMQEISHSDIREEFYQYNGTTQVPILRSFVMRYFSSMVLIFIGCLVICVLAVTCSTAVANYVSEIKATTQERVLVSRLHAATLNIKFARYDKLSTAPIKQQIISDGLGLLALDYKFRFGSKEDNLPGNIQDDNFLMNIYYGQSCPALANWQLTCDGLQTAFQVLVTNAVSMARLNDTQITYLMNQSDIVGAVDDYYIDPWLKSTRDYFQQQALDNINRTNVAVVVLFILLLPSLVIVNFLLQPIVQRIKDENTRTVKMLLILPFDVIDSIHPIREFLNTGQYNTNKQKQKKSLTSYLGSGDEMMRTIFLGNQEPIIVTSVAGEVDVINPQAEELFGVAKKDVFGKIFTSLLSPNDATKYNHSLQMLKSAALTSEEPKEFLEAKGVCKQEGATEKTFDIQICLSYSKVGGKNLIIHYIRDLTDLKSMEAHAMTQKGAFDIERKKMSDLVYNVFPHSVAEHLLKDSEDKEKVVFAEEYKEVTILFADLVGFTAMCSRLEPALLLLILNGIFSKWDALVDKYGLQKIKTIGDCYMVAGGVPDRTIDHAEKMLDFATEMKEALDTYNTSNNLLMTRGITLSMRVGINTGPVVAGIIGETRMCYDLWGDAVNVASRMESTSVEGRIQVSQSTYNHVKNNYEFEERTAEVKGKGVMLTYLLVGKRFVRSTSGTLLDLRFLKHSMGDPHSPSALSSYERSGSGPVSTSNVSIRIDSPTSNLLNSSTVSTPTSNSNPNTNRNTSNNNNNLTGSLKNSTGSLQATKSGNSLSTSSTSNLKPSTSTNNLK